MPSGTPVRVSWSAEVLGLCFFVCLLDVCLHDDDNPIKAISLESPWGTPYLFPALRAHAALRASRFLAPLGVTLDAVCSHFRPINSRIDFINVFSLIFLGFWLPFWTVFHEFDTLFALSYTRLIFTLIFIDFTWISTPPIPLKSRFYCSFIVFLKVLAHCTSISIFTCFVMDSDMFLDAFWHNISTLCQE